MRSLIAAFKQANSLLNFYPRLNQLAINSLQQETNRGFLTYTTPDKPVQKKQKEGRRPRNQEIQSKYVQLIDAEGQKQGVKPVWKILKEMDLTTHVLMQLDNSENPICRIYNIKQLYEREKQLQANKKQNSISLKEFKLSILIGEHDLNTKVNLAKKCLQKGNLAQFQVSGSTRNKKKLKLEEPRVKEYLAKVCDLLEPIAATHKPPSIVEGEGYVTFKLKKEKTKEKVKGNKEEL